MVSKDNNKNTSARRVDAILEERTPDDYARQQEDIRATQTHGESSLDNPNSDRGLDRTSEERERGQGVQPGSGKPV